MYPNPSSVLYILYGTVPYGILYTYTYNTRTKRNVSGTSISIYSTRYGSGYPYCTVLLCTRYLIKGACRVVVSGRVSGGKIL